MVKEKIKNRNHLKLSEASLKFLKFLRIVFADSGIYCSIKSSVASEPSGEKVSRRAQGENSLRIRNENANLDFKLDEFLRPFCKKFDNCSPCPLKSAKLLQQGESVHFCSGSANDSKSSENTQDLYKILHNSLTFLDSYGKALESLPHLPRFEKFVSAEGSSLALQIKLDVLEILRRAESSLKRLRL